MIVKCEVCEKEFTKSRSLVERHKHHYCSCECSNIARRAVIDVLCEVCSKTFQRSRGAVERVKHHYCSRECNNIARRSLVCVSCDVCGIEITRCRSGVERVKHHYCSFVCLGVARRSRHVCEFCGIEFERKVSSKSKHIFCSQKCQKQWATGPNHPLWQDGVSFEPYCIKFNDEFRERVREFQGRTCLICGMIEVENGRKLSVHHVDYNKDVCCNDRPPAFAAVCMRHNAQANFNRDRWQYIYHRIIDEVYDGKSYYTKEEYQIIIS